MDFFAVLDLLTARSAHSKVIPSLDLDPDPGLLALAFIEFISNPVFSEASSIDSYVF
uniref:Uncharacterized protein n=1 Tax=Podoviridae sp. ct8Lf7 TaxID=2827723 RepID=A0A8S5S068_9CAUD|nr:MAG TPA: hypothetical protein [Podoviridae sp. ct8Lf7]